MNDEVKVPGTEGIVATPAQQKIALDTANFFRDPLSARLAAYNPTEVKKEEQKSFLNSPAWQSYIADSYRFTNNEIPNDYRTYHQLEKMWRQPEFASIIEAHGSDMAVGGQLLSDYVDWDKVSWWDKQVAGISAARYGMRIGEARTKIAELEHEGADQSQIDMAKVELSKLEEYAAANTRAYDSETANAFASFGVSAARVVPEMVLTTAALGAVLPTGGAAAGAAATGATRVALALGRMLGKGQQAANVIRGLKTARAVGKAGKYIAGGVDLGVSGVKGLAQAGIVYNDTYRVTMGDMYNKIKSENPGITDEQAYDLADTSASLQAIVEAAPAVVGLGMRAAVATELPTAIRSVLTKVPKDTIKRAAFMQAFQQSTNKEVLKRIAAGWTKDAIADTMTEVIQQAAENATMEIADKGGDGTQVLSGTLERMGGFLLDPLNEKYSDELNTLLSTLPAAVAFGGIGPGVAYVGHTMSKNSVGSKISDVFNNARFGAQMRGYTQKELENGVASEAIKEQIRGMASRGDAPGSVYFDRTEVQKLVDTDPEFRRAMNRLGVLKQLNESQGNGGVIEVDFADYNEVVNGDKSDVLYQKVKDMVSFKIDSMTMSQLNEWIKSTEIQNKQEIQKAIANEKSVYNQTLKYFGEDQMFDSMTTEQRKANATLMQLVANRAAQSVANPMTAEEWFEQNVLLTKGEPPAQNTSLAQNIPTQKSLDNAQTSDTITSTQQGGQNGQAITGSGIADTIRRLTTSGQQSGSGRPAVLHGRIWSDKGTGSAGTKETKGVRVLELTPEAKAEFASKGIDTSGLQVLDGTVGKNADTFRTAILAAKQKLGEKAAAVDVKKVSEYKQMKTLLLSEDKQTGAAVTADGDIVSVFNANTDRVGGIYPVLRAAIEEGGKKLDCFDTFLPKVYSRLGFRAVARNNWVEMYKPEGWNKEYFNLFNNGEPDVVFMVYDPAYGQEYKRGDGELIKSNDPDADYGAGMTAQDKALQQIEAQQQLQQAQNNLKIIHNSLFQRLYQKAYAGSAVDYDRPSLKAIGTGEGNQAHGWGLYYALDEVIADLYRRKFTSDYRHVTLYDGKEIERNDDTPYNSVLSDLVFDYFQVTSQDMKQRKSEYKQKYQEEMDSLKSYVEQNKDMTKEQVGFFEERIDVLNRKLEAIDKINPDLIKEKQWGQVHEVDIPEMDVLLDEQKTIGQQSQFVQGVVKDLGKEIKVFSKDKQAEAEEFFEQKLQERKEKTDYERFDPEVEVNENGDFVVSYYTVFVPANSSMSGNDVYEILSKQLGSDKAASEYLESRGIKGITYEGQEDGRCFVIFNSDDVKVLRKKFDKLGNQLFQENEGVIAGWFDVIDGKYTLGLTKDWNATTFSHEAFHLYSRVLQDNYNNGTMTSYWKAQAEKLFNSVEAKPNKNGKIKLTKNQEELLAERFTTYLLENEIQNPELNSIFALLRDAFNKTYKQFNMTPHHPNAKTKEAFAVIFGAQDVAMATQRAMGLLEIERPEGVSQEAYDHYMSFILEARAKASHDMIKKYYRIEKFKQSKEYGKAYDEAYTRNLQAVEKESTYQIKALAKELKTTDIPAILLAYNATHGEAMVTEDDIVAALNETQEATIAAEARTAEEMDALIKEKFNIKDDQTLVSKETRNVGMAKAFMMEALMNKGKDWADFDAEYTKLLDMVENEVQKMPLSKIQNMRRWNQLESVYAQQYQMYASLGNKEKMAIVRRSQAQVVLIQNKMYEMNNRVDRFLKAYPKKLRNAQPQGKSVMSAESWDLLQSLMEQYGFKIADRRRSGMAFNIQLENWLKNIEDSEYCPISNIRYFMPETSKGHQGSFGSMTVRQFEVLEHLSNAINSIASREYFLITEEEKVRYDALAAETAQRLQEKGIKPYDENDTWVRKHLGILSNIVNPEPILKALFPEDVQRMIIRPFFSAAAKAETDFNEWNDQWNRMIQNVNLTNTKKKWSTGHVLSYNNVANLLLAMGTEHSYENWRLFLKVNEAQAEAIVAEAIAEQPALAEFANNYWAMMAKTTDVMNTSYRQRYNKLFVKKQARAFKIGDHEFTGGYVPETKLVSELPDDAGWESIIMGELSNEKLINDKPDGQDLQSIVDHTRSRLRLFARWGHVAPAFNNFVRFVQREDVGTAIGSRAQNYIRGWLRDYHTPAGDSAGLMHALMSATTTTVLGLRLPQALLQLSGVIPAMGLLGRGGIRYMASALGRTLSQGGGHQVAYARTKSAYMEARYSDPVKTMFGVSKAEMEISKTLGKFQKLAMSAIAYMDAIVSNATWEASYRMNIDNGMSDIEAREKADQTVRLSQTDAMTVSRARAMKSDWARIITPFSTYMMGMQSVVRGRIAEKEFAGAVSFALSYIAISTMFEAMLKEIPMPWEPEDDEKYLEKILKRWYNDTVSTAGSTLYPIAGIGSYVTESFAQGLEKVINPDEPTLIDMYGMGSLSALNYVKQYPDALRYGMIGIFNGDEDAQRKAIANFVGWFSAGGKRMVKDMMED